MLARRLQRDAARLGGDTVDVAVAGLAVALLSLARLMPWRTAVNLGGSLARGVGMRLGRSEKVGMKNLRLAFPEMSDDQRRALLEECWDNLGRTTVEYLFLDKLWDLDIATGRSERVEFAPEAIERFLRLRDDGKPAIILSAHLANWELPMVAAAAHGLEATALFRAPNNRFVAKWVLAKRKTAMAGLIASRKGAVHDMARALRDGKHLGILTDQYFYDGLDLPFFGHVTKTNQAFARLARLHDCPVHAVRVVRLPDHRFRVELTDEMALPRDERGRIDVEGSARLMNALFEGWIRENPGQWLWLHRKWR